ncbi:MAG: cytochrome b5 domain-containing protein [Christensenellales bacterium]|jgi:predicted heme/steroid binding protein
MTVRRNQLRRNKSPMKRYGIILMAVAMLLLGLIGCSGQSAPDASPGEQIELTLEELAAYDGKDGNPAYIAVDGVIYDVSGSSRWKDGEHNGYSAGQDLTDPIKNKSPHGLSTLSRVPAIGKIVD